MMIWTRYSLSSKEGSPQMYEQLDFEKIKALKVGDRFVETDPHLPGVMLEMEVTEAPVVKLEPLGDKEHNQARWKAKLVKATGHGLPVGSVVDYIITEGLMHYGPRISVRRLH